MLNKTFESEANIEKYAHAANMRIGKYEEIYEPHRASNVCCLDCKKAYNRCSWSKSYTPIKGWIARKTMLCTGTTSYKIYFCPEYERGEVRAKLQEEPAIKLAAAIAQRAALDYINGLRRTEKAKKALQNAEKNNPEKRGKQYEVALYEFEQALEEQEFLGTILPEWVCEKLKENYEENKTAKRRNIRIVESRTNRLTVKY